jgi:hypothetical protein
MLRSETDHARRFLGFQPHTAHSSKQRERVLADNLSWPIDTQRDCGISQGTNGPVLVCYPQDNASAIYSVADQFLIIGLDQ